MATCPACAEPIPVATENCPHCGIDVRRFAPGGTRSVGGRMSGLTIGLLIGGGVFMVLMAFCLCSGVPAALLLPAVQSAREAARRSQCQNNLKQIGLALHNYHETFGTFPPAYVADEAGRPMHSWRVLLLPYLDHQALYARYRFDEPWDGPNNSQLLESMPPVYLCPSHGGAGDTTTAYAGVFGANSMFRGAQPVALREVTDGASNTLLVGEATGAGIPWMKPMDVDITVHPAIGDPNGFGSDHTGGVHFLFGDGAVRFVPRTIAAQSLQALSTINGGEVVDLDF